MSQWINNSNLPVPVFKALTTDNYDKRGDFSVTELNNPPRISALKKRHSKHIVMDCINRFYTLFGTAMHYVMQIAKIDGAIIEQRFVFPFKVDGVTYQISMASDYVYPLRAKLYEMLDFKTTSIFAIKHGAKMDWIQQMNIYRYGFVFQGYDIVSLKIVAFLRDWSYTDAFVKKIRDYPKEQIVLLPVHLWDKKTTEKYLTDRIRLHAAARNQTDSELPACTPQERWEKFTCWAVLKKPNGDAVTGMAKFATKEEAEEAMAKREEAQKEKKSLKQYKTMVVAFRPGENTRCERYCEVNNFCDQYLATHTEDTPF